ncbi:hypothetical protein WMY93_025489, partial [Mugilogobius chulae]
MTPAPAAVGEGVRGRLVAWRLHTDHTCPGQECAAVPLKPMACVCFCGPASVQTHRGDGGSWSSVSETQLQIAKDSALVILNSIDEHDKVSILSVADTVRSCSLDQCYKSLLSPATSETKRKMGTFISNIKASDGFTQHAAGFQKAFQLLRNTTSLTKHPTMFNSVTATDMVIIYLSSGITSRESSEKEKKATLSVVREENRLLNNSVMILTYALMN